MQLAQRAIDNANRASRRIDELIPNGGSAARSMQDTLTGIVEEMKPYTAGHIPENKLTGKTQDRYLGAAQPILPYHEISFHEAFQIMSNDAIIKANSDLPKKLILPDTNIRMTIGGLDAFGMTGLIPEGADATHVYAMAGLGTKCQINDWQRLYNLYGGNPSKWRKMSEDVFSKNNRYVVHWYERDGLQIEGKVKDVKKP